MENHFHGTCDCYFLNYKSISFSVTPCLPSSSSSPAFLNSSSSAPLRARGGLKAAGFWAWENMLEEGQCYYRRHWGKEWVCLAPVSLATYHYSCQGMDGERDASRLSRCLGEQLAAVVSSECHHPLTKEPFLQGTAVFAHPGSHILMWF